MEYKYEVYAAEYKGDVMYVGSGKKDRHKHLTSGTSHVYLANKHHFDNKLLAVSIIFTTDSKEESLEVEKAYIRDLKPAWNEKNTTNKNKHKKVDNKFFVEQTVDEWYCDCVERIEFLETQLESREHMIDAICRTIDRTSDTIRKSGEVIGRIVGH